MSTAIILESLANGLAAVFAAAGVLHIVGPRWLIETYARWDYPARFRLVAAVLDIAAATFLLFPDIRAWGITLAGIITFFSVVALLDHKKYVVAAYAMLLMAALVPAALSVPRADPYLRPAVERPVLLSVR